MGAGCWERWLGSRRLSGYRNWYWWAAATSTPSGVMAPLLISDSVFSILSPTPKFTLRSGDWPFLRNVRYVISLFTSINVTVAASILLHFFGVRAGFPEREHDGNKFVVADKPVKQVRRNYCSETDESIIEERKTRRENTSVGFFDSSGTDGSTSNLLVTLFGS